MLFALCRLVIGSCSGRGGCVVRWRRSSVSALVWLFVWQRQGRGHWEDAHAQTIESEEDIATHTRRPDVGVHRRTRRLLTLLLLLLLDSSLREIDGRRSGAPSRRHGIHCLRPPLFCLHLRPLSLGLLDGRPTLLQHLVDAQRPHTGPSLFVSLPCDLQGRVRTTKRTRLS